MNTTPLVLPLALLLAAAPACSTPTPVEPHPPNTERLCGQTRPGTYGVAPVVDATKAKLDLAGADELLSAAMTDSGCFKVLERARLELLLNEIKLCADDNPDRSFFRCDAFAKKGKILGVQRGFRVCRPERGLTGG